MIPNDRQIKNKAELEVQVLFCCREGEINYLKQLLKRTYVTKESSIPKYINVNEPLGLVRSRK